MRRFWTVSWCCNGMRLWGTLESGGRGRQREDCVVASLKYVPLLGVTLGNAWEFTPAPGCDLQYPWLILGYIRIVSLLVRGITFFLSLIFQNSHGIRLKLDFSWTHFLAKRPPLSYHTFITHSLNNTLTHRTLVSCSASRKLNQKHLIIMKWCSFNICSLYNGNLGCFVKSSWIPGKRRVK